MTNTTKKYAVLGTTRNTDWWASGSMVGPTWVNQIHSSTYRKFAYNAREDKFVPVGAGNGKLPKAIERAFRDAKEQGII